MKWIILAAILVAFSAAESNHAALKQQAVNRLLYKVNEPIRSSFPTLKSLADSWDPMSHKDGCHDGGVTMTKLMADINGNHVLPKHHWFSLFNARQREEALLLTHVFLNCKDWNTLLGNAAYFREHMNEGQFVYAVYVAVTHSDLTQDIVLPPLYEVLPHLFTNSEIITQAYSAKMTQTPIRLRMTFTGSKKNPEQRVAYFGEDIGMNSHHVHWHMDFPFWWDGHKIDRKGELFFWAHHQLTARFDAERLSNNLAVVDELYWDRPIVEGFAPHTTYRYGGEFPSRPDNKRFEDVVGVAKIRDMKAMESRIRDAIAHGYITSHEGKPIALDIEHGIDILGDVIESSTYSQNPEYYGALHNIAHMMLGRQSDPKGKFKMPPGVMEHFETATRDPSFFRLHKYMNGIFKEHKDKLPPYNHDDLAYENVEIKELSVDGELTTYFEDFEFDLTHALDDTEDIADIPISTYVPRLNHKPFAYHINVNAKAAEKATVRIFMCPKYDSNHIELSLDEARWGCIEMDKFWVDLPAGPSEIKRKSSESSVAIPDRMPFADMVKKTDEAVVSGAPLSLGSTTSCGHPHRLLLPKGTEEGMAFELFVSITSGDDATLADMSTNEHGGNHGYCGIKGEKYPDKRAMGYPFDRPVVDDREFHIPNIKWVTVNVHHKH